MYLATVELYAQLQMTELQYMHLTLHDQYVSHNNLTKNFNRDPVNVYALKYMIMISIVHVVFV